MSQTTALTSQIIGRTAPWRAPSEPTDWIATVRTKVFDNDTEYRRCGGSRAATGAEQTSLLLDYLFLSPRDPHLPTEVFDRLRWGGQVIFVSRDARQVMALAARYRDKDGFVVEREPAVVQRPLIRPWLPWPSEPIYFFAARRVHLIPPGRMSDRFTYDVKLVRMPKPHAGYAVLKQIPQFGPISARLRHRIPDAQLDVILKGARKLVDKVFPVFLTREAAFLAILRRDLPAPYIHRIPRVIDVQKDGNGFVHKLYLEWLRNCSAPLSQLEFARQSTELLKMLHDKAGVMHLDLRLDNFVITQQGVGFVDFGSAVRIGENLAQNPMLQTLFAEMMTTSQIQRDLGKMVRKGKVTSRMLVDSHQKVDKGVDLFYLALQMNDPHGNPDLADLIRYDPQSEEARRLARLTHEILKPADPENPTFKSADDMLQAIDKIEQLCATST